MKKFLRDQFDHFPWMVYALVGLLQGLALVTIKNTMTLKDGSVAVWITVTALFYAPMFLLAYNRQHTVRLLFSTLVVSVIAALPFYWGDTLHKAHIVVLAPYWIITLCALHMFHQTFHQQNAWRLPYTHLFNGVWNNVVYLIFAGLFTFILWGIIVLTAAIFKFINITIFYHLFTNGNVFTCLTAVFFAIGLYLILQLTSVVKHSQTILLQQLRIFLPVISVILFIVVIALYAKLFFLSFNKTVINLFYLVAVVGWIYIICLNVVYQGGEKPIQQHKLLTWINNKAVIALLLLLLPFIAKDWFFNLHNYSLALNENLLTAYHDLLPNVLLLFIYSLSYSVLVLRYGSFQIALLGKVNIILGWIVIVTTLVLFQPYFPIFKIAQASDSDQSASQRPNSPRYDQIYQAFEKRFMQTPKLFWQSTTQGAATPANAIVLARRDNNQPVYACRANLFGGIHPGQLYQQRCVLTYGGSAYPQTDYQVLVGEKNAIEWSAKAIWEGSYFQNDGKSFVEGKPLPLFAGYETKRLLFLCRVIYRDQIYVGKRVGGKCLIADGVTEVDLWYSQNLWLAETNSKL
ncbi:MAG: hypothetical protein Tsb005_03970 [Gammaproteobacteria bacterium]